MATTLLSVRLSPWLEGALDQVTEWVGHTPSQLVEDLLEASEIDPSRIVGVEDEESLTEKINLRLGREAMGRLRRKAQESGTEPSVFIRLMLLYFFENYDAFNSVFPDAPDEEEWETLFEDEGTEDEEEEEETSVNASRSRAPVFLGAVSIIGAIIWSLWSKRGTPPGSPQTPA